MEQPVTCQRCGTEVLVEKYSWQHTNIQWTAPSAEVCPEVRAKVARGLPASRAPHCPHLREAVHQAAVSGLVEVPE